MAVLLPGQRPTNLPHVRIRTALRTHAVFVAVVATAAVLRLGVEIAYRPALFFGDSWRYLSMASTGTPVGVLPSRPSGYPLLLRLLIFPGHDLLAATIAQHLAGLAVGAGVYVLLVYLGVPRLLAAASAAVVLLDSYEMALEQFIMAETLFTLLVVGALALTIMRRHSARSLVLAGALLAVACTLRSAGLFLVPVWLLYLVWTARDRRRLLLSLAGVLAPLLLYGAWHATTSAGTFGLEDAQGWFLYGRVAQFADCRGVTVPAATKPLCNVPVNVRKQFNPGLWVWGVDSPAVRLFRGTPDTYARLPGGAAITARNDAALEGFATAMIKAHPGAYVYAVASDFLQAFDPWSPPTVDLDGVTVTFPGSPLVGWDWSAWRDRYYPGYVPRVHWPAPLLVRYQTVFHEPRLVLGLLGLVALTALVAPPLTRGRLRIAHGPEILLLSGSGLLVLLGSAALVGFVVRYLIPVAPLLIAGGVTAACQLVAAARRSDSG